MIIVLRRSYFVKTFLYIIFNDNPRLSKSQCMQSELVKVDLMQKPSVKSSSCCCERLSVCYQPCYSVYVCTRMQTLENIKLEGISLCSWSKDSSDKQCLYYEQYRLLIKTLLTNNTMNQCLWQKDIKELFYF